MQTFREEFSFPAFMPRPRQLLAGHAPGIVLALLIAGGGFALHSVRGFTLLSPMILSTLLGMLYRNFFGAPAWAAAGVNFCLKRVLRAGVVLLGLQLMLPQMMEVGGLGCAIIVTALISTFLFMRWLGALMGVEKGLSTLIATGTSICGASAILAANTVVQDSDEGVAYAIACVTILGSCAIFVYPLLPLLLGLSPKAFGLWAGASIHEIAQVVAAAFQNGAEAGQFATVAKLTRVMMLAPFVVCLGSLVGRRSEQGAEERLVPRPPMPWFVLGFVMLAVLNSVLSIPHAVHNAVSQLATLLLSTALGAMGLETDFRRLRAKGWKPFGLAFAGALFITAFSLVLIKLSRYS